jgi:hypothetical protein
LEGKLSHWPHVIKFSWHVKKPEKYERDSTLPAKFATISCQVSPDLLLRVSAGTCQKALVDESGIIRTQMGMHNRSENGHSAWDAL